ncbi:MAG: hypothetical protein ACI35W_04015 [Anaeroplasmataceae bacterium]
MRFREYKDVYTTDKVRKGIVRGRSLSDELDSATVILSQIGKIDIESNDLIELTNESGDLEYWFVANYNRKTVSFKPIRYNYVVDLMSITRFLETIILPNLTITNIGQNRSILTYINNAMQLYFKSEYGGFIISDELIELCENTVCPECTFEEPTLREYLDHLLGFENCLAKLEFRDGVFVLTYLDLNPNGTELNTDYITYMEQSQCAEQYVTQLEHTFKDVIAQFPIVEYHKMKSESYMFDTETGKLILHHKPYDIKRIVAKNVAFSVEADYKYSNSSNIIDHANIYVNSGTEPTKTVASPRYINNIDLDITEYLVVDKIFQSLETLPQGGYNTLTDDLVKNNYMNNSLRWSRGSREIDNFHYYQTKTVIWSSSDEPAITYAIRSAIYKRLSKILGKAGYVGDDGVSVTYLKKDGPTSGIIYNWNDGWKNVVFEVEYIPYINARLKIQQDLDFRHLISAPDNTTNATTNISSFIKKSLEKNRQLGNDSLMFYARSLVDKDGYGSVYDLGQYYIDEDGSRYVLNYLETETKNNCVLYKGILTKNYSNRNIHTVINREKRYYSLADNSESLIRNEVRVKKYKVSLSNEYNPNILMLVLPLNILKFSATANEDSTIVSGYIPSDTIAERNIISHSALFEDNVAYATRVGSQKNGGYEMEYLKYTDSYGEISAIEVDFRCSTGKDLDVILNCEVVSDEKEAFVGSSKSSFEFLKDSREQLCITVENIIVNDPNDSNITLYGDRIANLLNSSYISINSNVVGYLMRTDTKVNFGKPLHELVGDLTYPTTLEIVDQKGQVCISIANYNGEYLILEEIV